MRPWPAEAHEVLLNLLRKVKDRAAIDLRGSVREVIEDVLASLDDENDDDDDMPPPAKKLNAVKTPQPRMNGNKRRVKSAIETIRERDREAGRVGKWRDLDDKGILEVVNEQQPPLKLTQISNVFSQADKEIRESRKLNKFLVGKLPTGTEWIVSSTMPQSPRYETDRRRAEKRRAAGQCVSCGKDKDIEGTSCSSCKERTVANNRKRAASFKSGWTSVSLEQLQNQAFKRIKPIEHRETLKFYIAESKGLVEKALLEIEEAGVSRSCRHKVGMVGKGGMTKRNQAYATHSSELRNTLSWHHEDVNVVTFGEIGLGFGLLDVFESHSDNVPHKLGHYHEEKFSEDGGLIAGELYLHYN